MEVKSLARKIFEFVYFTIMGAIMAFAIIIGYDQIRRSVEYGIIHDCLVKTDLINYFVEKE